jgi:hypothetical protein
MQHECVAGVAGSNFPQNFGFRFQMDHRYASSYSGSNGHSYNKKIFYSGPNVDLNLVM